MTTGSDDLQGDAGSVSRWGLWPILFVALALLALAAYPLLQDRRVAAVEDEIIDVLQPAASAGRRLALLKAREMAQYQAYLLTGEPVYRTRYEELRRLESEVYDELRSLVERTDLAIREQLAALYSTAEQWHRAHDAPLSDPDARAAALENVPIEQARYSEVLEAARNLEQTISEQESAAWARMERARNIRIRTTVILALLALGATAVLATLGRRLRELVEEAEEGRSSALRARRTMEAVLEATGDGVLGFDLDGRCITVNRTGSELLGFSEVDARHRSPHELLHGKAPEGKGHAPERCPVMAAFRSGTPEEDADDVVWRRDGTSFPARWHLRPLLDGRVVKGAVLTLSDMTEIRAAERALRKAVRARDEVVAVVSHDLRNPIGTVSAAAELLTELDLSPEQEREQVAIIRRSAARMRRLIEDLLDVARIEAGGLAVERRVEPVRRIVAEAMEAFQHQAREAEVELRSRIEEGLPRVWADRDRILQVLSNLIANGLKFTPPGGSVTLAASAHERGVRLTVEDQGPGISPEDQERLFDRFWQVERTSRSGAGLGLAIVKGIVDAHGGEVWVESTVGEGSAFHVLLPRTPRDPGGLDAGGERRPS